ncbi:LysR family transcriptional regulator [Thiomonas bhubaneswarensis]|uniref:DNA-binding transcriptional regulator, LysR family n=1 Tax=Thiomonas bhubaneswarensis TaxID=339866 RepID=A0A0K6HTC6_9BURK|nr:LysR family transcriptional regulator [Thiomonas bhubaneswarensis]CUA94292.1 DNA-binding transcriptional regulator, LysR family [Thiomonas bhubaneswarensis]
MLDLDACRIFARVVETHSFSEAARSLDISLPVVSKQVARLERQLGTRLLNRTTRHLSLSEAGSAFHAHCLQLIEIAQTAEAAVSQFHLSPRGQLRVSAPVAFANGSLAPLLPAFLERYPDVQLELDASDRQVDLAEDGYDLAIRLTARPPEGLVARPLHRIRRLACAADVYLQRRGIPLKPEDLAQHNCLIYPQAEGAGTWTFERDGRPLVVPVRGSFRSNSTEALRQAARLGLGVVYMRDYAVRQDLLDGNLHEVLADYAPPSRAELFALYLPNRFLPPKVRVFIDYLVDCFDQP